MTRRPRLRPRASPVCGESAAPARPLPAPSGGVAESPGEAPRLTRAGGSRRGCGRPGSLARGLKPLSQGTGAARLRKQAGTLTNSRSLQGGGVPGGRADVLPGLCWLRQAPPIPRPGGLSGAGETSNPACPRNKENCTPFRSLGLGSLLGPRGPAPHSPGAVSPQSPQFRHYPHTDGGHGGSDWSGAERAARSLYPHRLPLGWSLGGQGAGGCRADGDAHGPPPLPVGQGPRAPWGLGHLPPKPRPVNEGDPP